MAHKNPSIVQVGNPTLRKTCLSVGITELKSSATRRLIDTLHKNLQEVGGVGLAAPQIGVSKRIFVVHIGPTKFRPNLTKIEPYAVINPEIVTYGTETDVDYEGCFSVAEANLFAQVLRSNNVSVVYTDQHGKTVSKELSGLEARVFQHEYDHLNGLVFLDKETDASTVMSGNEYKKMRKTNSQSLHDQSS